jgi:signal transduction histidine kinase
MSCELDGTVLMELDDVDTRPVAQVLPILVVDDTPASLVAAEVALEPLARRIVTAGSGDDALARLLDQDFALILLDVQMPGMDGYETARWIRERERTKHVPIIFTTAHDQDQAGVLRAYSLGAVDFLFKPIVPEVLCAKASVFISLQERTEQLANERMEREFEKRQRELDTAMLRRERDRELQANLELGRLNEALAESDRRKDTFIAILAHELRNPLAPVRTCIDMIRQGHPVTPRLLDVLDRQTGVLARLVDDLLDLARVRADKIELRPEKLDLVELVENAITTSRPLIDERGHAITVDAPTERVAIIADSIRLAQVLSNLLNNAARYTPRGGRIEVACGASDGMAFVRVTDSGVGIPQELQETIFKMFVQERVSSDGSGGLGLGLALARRLIEMHNGSIAVESGGRGCGATFTVRIPVIGSPLALEIRKRTRDLAPMKLIETPAGPIRTIVIDDNEDARELLSDLLRARGYEVLTAADGPTGLGLIREHQPHVALVDLGLPGLDGVGVAQQLHTECPELRTRLVALTGYGEAADRERTQRAGFHAHLVKPASAATLLACLTSQLEGREP